MTDSDFEGDGPPEHRPFLHPARWSEEDIQSQCRWTFSRASGPGGQNRNKVETSASIEFLPTKDIAHANERRTQGENRKIALQRLRCKLAIDFRTVALNEPLPIELHETSIEIWRKYCRNGRVQISEDNWDWPALLSILLDMLAGKEWDLQSAAIALGVSSTQAVKLLKKEPLALARLNQERADRGKHPLR